MKGPEGYGEIINIIMNIAMGLIITIAINCAICMQVGMNIITVEAVCASWFSSFVIGYTVGELGDPMGWSMKLGHALKIKGSFVQHVLNSLVLGVYFGTIILFGNMLITNLPNGVGAWLGGFISWWLFVAVAAVISVFVILKPVQSIASKLSGFDPRAVAPDN